MYYVTFIYVFQNYYFFAHEHFGLSEKGHLSITLEYTDPRETERDQEYFKNDRRCTGKPIYITSLVPISKSVGHNF